MSIDILGVKINTCTKGEALDRVAEFLSTGGANYVFTPNPEMIMLAQKDSYFKEILNKGDLNICDGKGLKMSIRMKQTKKERFDTRFFKRIAGVDFMLDICEVAERDGFSIYLLGSKDEKILRETKDILKINFPRLEIAGYHPGPEIESIPNKKLKYRSPENERVLIDINQTSPDIVFVGFGHGKQEKWIDENMEKLPSVRLAMGVGGSFDMISGEIKRCPRFFDVLSLEWLWRLIQQPSRFKRIFTALFKFPLLFISRLYINKRV
jgi:N-acetylglucosaminyldiphosphoundecaprenol N-acetyl-beta-D-mannosaminyltransferase